MATYALTVSTNALGLGVIDGATVRIEKRRVAIADAYPPINNLIQISKATNSSGIATFLLEPDDLTTYHVAKIFDLAGVFIYQKSFTMPPSASNLHDSSISTVIGGSLIQFKENGNDLGTPITVRNVDIVGSGVDATFTGDTVTIDVDAAPLDVNGKVPDQYLSFVQSGTNAVGRTVQGKLREVVSVKDFGAVGDGETDDTAAIQAALDAAVVVSLPAGTYKITSTLVFNDWGNSLIGESICAYGGTLSKSTLLHSFNGDLVQLNPTASGARGRHRIKYVQFKSDNVLTGVGLRITGSQDVVEGCAFYQFRSGGIRIGGKSYGTYIEKCSFDQCGAAGAYDISGDADTGASDSNYNTITLIADNIFESSQTGAVSLKNSDPFYIIRNYVEPFNSESTSPMIRTENSTSGNTKGWIQDNYIGSLLAANGFAISATGAYLDISGNTCLDFVSGIFISTLIGNVTGNRIRGFSTIGIQVYSAAVNQNNNVVVSANSLESKSTGAVHGILMGGSVNGVNVTGNLVRGICDYYIRMLSCSNVLVSGNEVAPFAGGAASGSGIYEDTTNTSNNSVKGNSVVATTPYRRISFKYDIFYASAAPVSGDWLQGNIVWNSAPVAGGIPGWVCVASGTPGTWKAMANLEA